MKTPRRRVYRLYDFAKSRTITTGRYYPVSANVNSADKLYIVIEHVKIDYRHTFVSTAPLPA